MFAAVGLLVTGAIFGLTSRRFLSWRGLFAIAGIAALVLLAWIEGIQTRGGSLWWQQPLWRNLLLYCAMFTGTTPKPESGVAGGLVLIFGISSTL